MREKNDFLQHRAATQLIQCSARKKKKSALHLSLKKYGKLFVFVRLEITKKKKNFRLRIKVTWEICTFSNAAIIFIIL